MPAQAVSQAATVDWNIVAGAVATFIVTLIIAWTGRVAGKKKVEAEENKIMPAIMTGAMLQDNYTIMMATEANRNLAEELRMTRAAVERLRDTMLETKLEMRHLADKLS